MAPNVHDEATCTSRKENSIRKIVSAEDREAHAQAFVVSFIAEHSLPFTMSPHLIRFAQTLSSDSESFYVSHDSSLQIERGVSCQHK